MHYGAANLTNADILKLKYTVEDENKHLKYFGEYESKFHKFYVKYGLSLFTS
jgi:hypothetical protein